MTHGGGWVPAVNYVNPKYNHAVVPRLLEGTKYEFRVFAENLQGRSDPLDTEKPVVAKNQYGECKIPNFQIFDSQSLIETIQKIQTHSKSNALHAHFIRLHQKCYRCPWKTWQTRTCGQ